MFPGARIAAFHEVEVAGGLFQDLFHRRGASLRHLPRQSQLMLAKEPPEPFMVDRPTGPLLKLWKNPAVSVFQVLLYDLSNLAHQSLVFFAWAVRALLSVGRR
jgi:hypothetical protein